MVVKQRRLASVLLIAFAISTALLTSAGTSADPLLTLSYFTQTYLPGVAERTAQKVEGKIANAISETANKAKSIRTTKLDDITKDRAAEQVAREVINELIISGNITAGGFRRAFFSQGEQISGVAGSSFYLESGTIIAVDSGIADLTAGGVVDVGTALKAGSYYVFAENGGIFRINSAKASIRIRGAFRTAPYYAQNRPTADALKILGLFKGTAGGYELGREATRLEGLIMLIRLMGEEQEALSFAGAHPFKDVPVWAGDAANKYVAYAYSKGYTNGINKTQFGTTSYITGPQYVTMVLRALGYSDSAGDFVWDKSFDKAAAIGLYTAARAAGVQQEIFRRDQVVEASGNALFISTKGSNDRLIDSLRAKDIFSAEAMEAAVGIINKGR